VIRILLADDQPLVRTGFKMILDAEPDMAVVGEAGDGADVKSGVLLALIVATWLLPINLLTTRRFHFLVVAPIMLLWIATAIFLAWQARARERLRNSTGVPEFRAAV